MQHRDARLRGILFAIYVLLYGGFVLLNAFSPETMERTPFAGVNLAISYGFVLIIAAFVLSMIYGLAHSGSDATDGHKPAGSSVAASDDTGSDNGEGRA